MKTVSPKSGVLKIKPHMAQESAEARLGIRIDISSNESAYGPSPSAVAAARSAAFNMERYSDHAASILAEDIASYYKLRSESIVCGHGSDDILSRIARVYLRPGDELICSVNGYQKFPNYAFANDATPVIASDREFTADIDSIADCLTEKTRMVMIANPDNPTGTYLSGEAVRKLHSRIPEHVLLVLDSAYLEYVDAEDFENPVDLIAESNNIVMTRTFSKLFGLAGIRLGWAYAHREVADALRRIGLTFSLSNVALESGRAALKDESYSQYVHGSNIAVREQFIQAVDGLGMEVMPTQTNFFLARFVQPGYSASRAYNFLMSRGILARRMASGAFDDYIRFTIGLEREMHEVVNVLQEFFSTESVNNE